METAFEIATAPTSLVVTPLLVTLRVPRSVLLLSKPFAKTVQWNLWALLERAVLTLMILLVGLSPARVIEQLQISVLGSTTCRRLPVPVQKNPLVHLFLSGLSMTFRVGKATMLPPSALHRLVDLLTVKPLGARDVTHYLFTLEKRARLADRQGQQIPPGLEVLIQA